MYYYFMQIKNHPKYLNGEATEEDLYLKFLANFETNGLSGKKVSKEMYRV